MTATVQFEELSLLLEDPVAERAALAADGYFFRLLSTEDGLDLSSANATVEQVVSAVFAGATAEVSQYENLSATLPLQVVGADSGGMARGAAALEAVCRRAGMRALTFQAGDGASRPTVYDVLVATWKVTFDDQAETFRNTRTYILTLVCKPFPRSATAVTVPAIEIPTVQPTVTVVDDGSSATNWSTTSKQVSRVNLIPNPSFATGVQGWSKGSGITSLTKRSGQNQAVVVPADSGQRYINSARLPVSGGLSYAIQMSIGIASIPSHPSGSYGFRYQFFDASGAAIVTEYVTKTWTLSVADQRPLPVSKVVTAPSNAVTFLVSPFASGLGANFWTVQDVMLEQSATVGSYFDGDRSASGTTENAWSGTRSNSPSVQLVPPTVAASGGQLSVSAWSKRPITLTRAGSVDTSAKPVIRVTGTAPGNAADGITLNGQRAALLTGSNGAFTGHWLASGTTTDGITVSAQQTDGGPTGNTTLTVTEVAAMTSLPLLGTGRSGERTIQTYGTMPAEASLTLANSSGTLGNKTIVYTAPGGTLSPALRPYRSAGPSILLDSTSLSGATETLATTQASAVTFKIGVNAILRSSYLLMAHLTGSGLTAGAAYTVSWRAWTGDTAASLVTTSGSTVITATGTTQAASLYELGLLTLPTWDVTADDYSVSVQIWVSGGTWKLDEGWLFDVDNGDLSVIDNSMLAVSSIEIVPASADHPQARYLGVVGTTTVDLAPWVRSWTQHHFDPASGASVYAYLANDATTPALSMSAEFYPRWGMFNALTDDDTGDDQAA